MGGGEGKEGGGWWYVDQVVSMMTESIDWRR